jgi:hypothetical protein
MPPRLVCVAILLFWVVAASSLIRRDVLPELRFAGPPDLLSIARAVRTSGPSRWSVLVIDDPGHPDVRRSVGEAVTESVRQPDGGVLMSSRVRFDSGGLLRGTVFAPRGQLELVMVIASTCQIDRTGNLRAFSASVRPEPDPQEVLRVEGRLNARGDALEVVARGPLPMMNQTRTIPYQERSLVQNAMEPFDYLPGLQVGQRWESRSVNPLNGRIEPIKVEVTRKTVIHWDNHPVTTWEVVQHIAAMMDARTWVRIDGLVLRQEVPFPLVKLVLERQPGPQPEGPGAGAVAGRSLPTEALDPSR